ncbi:MAG: hypothetical protein IJQ25_07380 [Oscillibacter sp.]|nr:hypothetical protein [Oscillibacter sp.]
MEAMTSTCGIEERAKVQEEALKTLRAMIVCFHMRGFTAWEIARKLTHDLTPVQMWGTVATLKAIGESAVADEVRRFAERAEREEAVAEQERRKREHVGDWYICDAEGALLEIVEDASYAFAAAFRDTMAERLDIDPEGLDVLTADEYEGEYGADA